MCTKYLIGLSHSYRDDDARGQTDVYAFQFETYFPKLQYYNEHL